MDNELFELCKTVYERTKWVEGNYFFDYNGGKPLIGFQEGWYDDRIAFDGFYPLYTFDYLFPKLEEYAYIELSSMRKGGCRLVFEPHSTEEYDSLRADTPLKALLKLAIKLSDTGELEKSKR